MAEAVVSFVVNEIGKLLIDEAKYLHGARHQAELLETELNGLLRYLRDADARQGESEIIQGWLSEARSIAYEAENAIERYAFQKPSIALRLACIFKECYVLHHARSEIDSVIARISTFRSKLSGYGIHQSAPDVRQSRIQDMRRTYSHSVEEEENIIVGLEDNLEMLMGHVLDPNNRFVSIIGMGGLGKSTMARKIYKHHRVQDYFDKQVWFCISQQWQTKDILQGVLLKLDPHQRKHILRLRDEELVRELNEFQTNKKCLIVLDDIWSSHPWECIQEAFPKSTKILLTTRNRQVAEHVMSSNTNCFIHQLRLLSKEESWELFQKKAMINTLQPQELKEKATELGKEIVEHCGGLPLAVITLGGILSTKHTLDDMESVCKNVKNLLGRVRGSESDSNKLKNIVDSSYYDLPYYLKPCFLYLGMFPEDREIPAVTLYQLWLAEGFLLLNHKRRGETMMDVAVRYLRELVQRCMVEVQSEEKQLRDRRFRRFGSCRLHDVMRELCLGIAEKENFCKIINYQNREGIEQTSGKNITRLQLFVQEGDLIGQIPIGMMDRHLRSFRILGGGTTTREMVKQISGSENFKMLKVLAIENIQKTSRLIDLSKLIHLRYLSLRGSKFWILPPSISKLQHLQTLIISEYDPLDMFNHGMAAEHQPAIFDVLWKLGELRYLHLPSFYHVVGGLTKYMLRLDDLSKLEMLENLSLNDCNVEDLKKLVNLQVLSATVIEKLELVSQLLMNIVTLNLRFMSISIHEVDFRSSEGPAVLRQILSSTNLSELYMFSCKIEKWPRQYEVEDIRHSAIQSLKLFFTHNVSDDDVDPMETLEKLPNLQYLAIIHSYDWKEMTCHATGFPNLRDLEIYGLENLERIKVEEGAMPKLRSLMIGDCPKLEMIPDGLRFITSLQELYIGEMPSGLVDRIRVGDDGGEGPDFYKIRHVPIIKLD